MEDINFLSDIDVYDCYDTKKRINLREKAKKSSKLRCNTLICVLENPSNYQNVGTVIRNVNTIGVSKVYIIDGKQIFIDKTWKDLRSSKVLNETSATAIKWTFVKIFKTAEECFEHLEKNNYISFGTSPHIIGKKNVCLDEGIFTQKKLAVWFGTETTGMTQYSIDRCSCLIQIPISGIIESFNLAVSTGIIFYEICKQRRQFKK